MRPIPHYFAQLPTEYGVLYPFNKLIPQCCLHIRADGHRSAPPSSSSAHSPSASILIPISGETETVVEHTKTKPVIHSTRKNEQSMGKKK
ncbi:hypothetical protein ROHU_023686 [Labeo rohita]|uniref:Uncharacterized protein n=1 Tax=Labeo rohita TaxID=84645 RepID=A0A498MLC9_LABRO|nr:hypothetical protein ROHU_023686 [Labeo rohita]